MIRDGDRGRIRVFAVVEGYGTIELGSFRSQSDAEAAEEKAAAIERAGGESAAVFADRWVSEFPRPSASSNKVMSYGIRHFARDFGERPLDEVTPREARAWALEHPGSANYARALYEDAISVGLAQDNPFRGIRLRGRTRRDLHLPTEAELLALIEATPPPMADIIGLAAYTGLRLGELLGLSDEDIGERNIRVERQRLPNGDYSPPKWGIVRMVALVEQARPFLGEGTPLFKLSRSSLWSYWRGLRTGMGYPELPFHGLRHWHATWLLDQGATPEDIAIQLGHRDGGTLVRALYGHPDQDAARDRLRRIANGEPGQ